MMHHTEHGSCIDIHAEKTGLGRQTGHTDVGIRKKPVNEHWARQTSLALFLHPCFAKVIQPAKM